MNRHPSWIFGKAPLQVAQAHFSLTSSSTALHRLPPSVPAAPPSEHPSAEEPAEVVGPEPLPTPSAAELELAAALAKICEEKVALEGRLAEAAVQMARLRRDVLEASEPELVKLALAIAERVVGRELTVDPALVVTWAKESLATLGASDDVVIAIAPDVAASVPDEAWTDLSPSVAVRPDPLLPEGEVEVRSAEGRVRASARARMSAVGEALGVGDPR